MQLEELRFTHCQIVAVVAVPHRAPARNVSWQGSPSQAFSDKPSPADKGPKHSSRPVSETDLSKSYGFSQSQTANSEFPKTQTDSRDIINMPIDSLFLISFSNKANERTSCLFISRETNGMMELPVRK
jgi:hypothetical protein